MVILNDKAIAHLTARISGGKDGWFRCSLTWDIGTETSSRNFISITAGDGILDDTGDGVDGIYIWGVQLEINGEASGYIKTEATSQTRFLI